MASERRYAPGTVVVLVGTKRGLFVLTSPDRNQRQAGLELLRQLCEAGRAADRCRRRAEEYRSRRPRLTQDEQKQLDAVLDTGLAAATLDDALGLMDPAQKTKPVPPRKRMDRAARNKPGWFKRCRCARGSWTPCCPAAFSSWTARWVRSCSGPACHRGRAAKLGT